MASDWGLIYTSHHYDSLLSNPWGFTRFGLAAARNAGTEWDWFNNRKGCSTSGAAACSRIAISTSIWPVGLRGTQDRSLHVSGRHVETRRRTRPIARRSTRR